MIKINKSTSASLPIKRVAIIFLIIGLTILAVWLSSPALAQTHNHDHQNNLCVRPDGANGCYTTIQAAVNSAVNGDTITIAGGTYTESVSITRSLSITGGWQPTGWPFTETVVQANGADCALSLDNVSGSLNNLTAMGANVAGICGTELLTYTMANVSARNNMGDGTAVEVSHTLTISQSDFNNNQQNGLVTSCTYSSNHREATVNITNSTSRNNTKDGFNGGYGGANCNFYLSYHRTKALENGLNGFNGYGSVCPTFTGIGMSVEISASTIMSNGTGIKASCGSSLLIQQNVVQHNGTGIRSDEAGFISINNLYTDNQSNGLEIRAGYWESTNDTIANNGLGELVLFDDVYPGFSSNPIKSACDTPNVKLTNTIIWDTNRGIEWYTSSSCPPYFPGPPFMVEINNSLIAGRDLLIDEQDIIYFTIGTAVYDTNPFFAGNGNYHLLPPSLAIDGGTPTDAPSTDIDGQPRPIDGDGNGIPDFDMGAYEAPPGIIWRAYSPLIRG